MAPHVADDKPHGSVGHHQIIEEISGRERGRIKPPPMSKPDSTGGAAARAALASSAPSATAFPAAARHAPHGAIRNVLDHPIVPH